ncbi:MAG: polysaccharide deacetylase family protein [Lachnospiraceae bacterium]|nr:polysaccharide deacetylase family protein [Lachnospiraceae bacterium]
MKYFCWNIDDGLEQDKKIIEEFRKDGIAATFNLNAGWFGRRQLIGRIGNLGMKDVLESEFRPGFHLLKYSPSYRIPADEVAQVYAGFEIASHGLCHENFKKISDEEAVKSIKENNRLLKEIFGQEIVGFAYPYGAVGPNTEQQLRDAGIKYARTVGGTKDFCRPENPMQLPMTAWHIQKDVMDKIDQFIAADGEEEDLFFLLFAHGYEFDFNTPESNWEKFYRICDKVAGRDDIVCCSTREGLGI